MPNIICALPPPGPTGWGTAGKYIVEELKKLTTVNDLNDVATNGRILTEDFPWHFNNPLLMAILGVNLMPMYLHLTSDHRVGYCFIEDNILVHRYMVNAWRMWNAIATGSTWATRELSIMPCMPRVVTAIQGVDHAVFYPSRTTKPDPNWFTIFSGGKFEYRKAQDVVIRAVKVMMDRHKDVRMLASWWNPWHASADTMRQSKLINYPGVAPRFEHVARFNGLDGNRVQFVGGTGNADHNELSIAMNFSDIGVFPNRAEAGTNLVLMEAMACGMPVIATCDHGHADVTGHLAPPFRIQTKSFTYERGGQPVGSWYEPNLDDLIDKIEYAYGHRDKLVEGEDGLRNHEAMKPFTWEQTARVLFDACTG